MNAKLYCFVMALAAISGCGHNDARISGRLTGHVDGVIYLDLVEPQGRITVDSMELSPKGDFRFKVRLPEGEPTFYNLRHEEGVIPLLLMPGEKVRVNSICDIALNYDVEGSDESARIRELQMLLTHGGIRLDSLRRVVFATTDSVQRAAYMEYISELNRIKREHLHFIVALPNRLSSLYGLYQRLAGEPYLFNADNDILYYRMVADSVESVHPNSPYVVALRREVDKANSTLALSDLLVQKLQDEGDGYPDLALPDIYGVQHELSSLEGKVILVDFWLTGDGGSRLNNAELKELYGSAHERGFEVYQVSLDEQKALWVAAVQDQRLPWISVGDMLGAASPAVAMYNVTKVPTNFLIDREGTIVGRDLYGDRLVAEVNKLL